MRNVTRSSVSALAALFIGSTALASIPAFAAPVGVQIAQAEPERKGGERGGEKGAGGSASGDRGGGPRMERAPRGDVAPRSERAPRGGGERGAQAPNVAPNVAPGPRPAPAPAVRPERRSMERNRPITRRDAVPDRRYDRRYSPDRRFDDRRNRVRPGYRQGFVFLGGPRVVVRGYGPNWCRGLHRGYHWAPRIGWHAATHRGLFRC